MAIYEFPAEAGEGQGGPPSIPALEERLRRFGLPAERIQMEVEGDTVVLTGSVPDGDAHERVLLAVGNTRGVGVVDDRLAQDRHPGLLDSLGAFAHVPTGARFAQMAEKQVEEADTPREQVLGPGGSAFHLVRNGETLEQIARREYGDGNAVLRIMDANRPMLAGGAEPAPGTVLRLPAEGVG